MEPIIELRGLTKQYDTVLAVDHLDLSIGKGQVFGLLGPNGAGKSTTILMMLGLTDPTAGSARVCGVQPDRDPVAVKRKVGYLPDNVGFYNDMTGLENLVYIARLNRKRPSAAREEGMHLLERVGLKEVAGRKAGKYSRGMVQRLGLAEVLIKNPEVIILDEPTLGIDPAGVREFLDLIVRLSREEGLTVLLSSHHLHQVQQVCDRVGLFVSGKLIAEGDIATLSSRLFGNEPVLIEAGVDTPAEGFSAAGAARLQERIRGLDGVTEVRMDGRMLQVSCRRDLSAAIAQAVIEAGWPLTALHKREHGLDDIYHRYFEQEKVA